jgi:hypothetical protein
MFGLFTRWPSRKSALPVQKTIRLALEGLEIRDCMSAPVLSLNFTATPVANHQVQLNGYLTTDSPATITFSGAATGTMTGAGTGTFSFLANGGTPGAVYAVAVDQSNLTSNSIYTTYSPPNSPSLWFSVMNAYQNYVTISGQVSSVDQANNQVIISGVVSASGTPAATDATGHFSLTIYAPSLGNVQVSFTDSWGQNTTGTGAVTSDAPIVSNFGGECEELDGWTFTGHVTAPSPQGLIVTFTGLPELEGDTVQVDAQGNFSFSVELQPDERGTVTAQTTDWFGQASNIAFTFVF